MSSQTVPRPATIGNDSPLPEHVGVFIVGAGFAGLGAAIKLAESGEHDFICVDRGNEVGGTWRDNTYPGAACDVPSQLYSFSFALNPSWSRSFSPQPEIQNYLRSVAHSSGVLNRFRFGVTFESATWDADSALWRIETSVGPTTADLLVAGGGALSDAKMPAIEGIDGFGGEIFHSSQWNHESDLTGKRVAIIGTGASSIQIVPAIAERVGRLDVYQRTAPWVMPRRDRRYTKLERFAMRRIPFVQRFVRDSVYFGREATVPMFIALPQIAKVAAGIARAHIGRAIKDPVLRAKVTPNFTLGCKRVLLSNDWYPALARPNVDLVTEPIVKIDGNSIVTADGAEREVDVLVVATGFMANDLPIASMIKGKNGQTLADEWAAGGMQAYKGSTVAGFPNLFFIVGPNTGLGHSSMVYIIESQIAYVVDARRTMKRHEIATVEPLEKAQREWNRDLQRRMQRTVWTRGGCQSWYLDKHGRNTTLWPRTTYKFRQLTSKFDLAAYRSAGRDSIGSDVLVGATTRTGASA